MKLNLLEKLGDGAFADVWRATDELDREVAVKIIRPANLGVADALAHAKALARAVHPNVVSVITLETTTDPESGEQCDCVVMELLRGITLTSRLDAEKLKLDEARLLGTGIIDGLAHIHKQGMAHGDLHSDNVMVVDGIAKVIDILYLNSLAMLSTEKQDSRLRRDLISLRLLLQQIILQSEVDRAEATEFNNLLEVDAICDDIRSAFLQILSAENSDDNARAVDHAFGRFTEEEFIEGEAYAAALAEETPTEVILPLLKRVAEEKTYLPKNQHYIQAVWARLAPPQRAEFLTHISSVIESETPKGKWWPGLQLISALGAEAWPGLRKIVQIKLEGLIVKDVLAGHKDIYSVKNISGGALGTYAISFWRYFSKPDVLADNLISLLRQNWYTQNYVASFFLYAIPGIANSTGKRPEFIQAFRVALRNKAHLIVNKLEELPQDWVQEIRDAAT